MTLRSNRPFAASCTLGVTLAAALLLALPACTVYTPMQPTMPLLRKAGEAEFSASVQANGRVEATGAFSPAKGVVFTGAGTASAKLGEQNFLVTRQYEVGGGLYRPLGGHWLLSALAGYGQAYSNRGYVDLSLFGPGTFSEYRADYTKYFGQVGMAHTELRDCYGFTYRLTQVRFGRLEDLSIGTLPLKEMLRHEALFFYRVPLGPSLVPRWHVQAAFGLSVSSTPRQRDDLSFPTYGRAEYHANRNLLPAFLASVGLVYTVPTRRRD